MDGRVPVEHRPFQPAAAPLDRQLPPASAAGACPSPARERPAARTGPRDRCRAAPGTWKSCGRTARSPPAPPSAADEHDFGVRPRAEQRRAHALLGRDHLILEMLVLARARARTAGPADSRRSSAGTDRHLVAHAAVPSAGALQALRDTADAREQRFEQVAILPLDSRASAAAGPPASDSSGPHRDCAAGSSAAASGSLSSSAGCP